MQFWKNFNNGKMERLEDSELKKHPEKLDYLLSNSYTRVTSETNDKAYSEVKNQQPKKKKKSKK